MSDLRARVIRLAHQRPELRPHLVPLLREARTNLQVGREYRVQQPVRLVGPPNKFFKPVTVPAGQKIKFLGNVYPGSLSSLTRSHAGRGDTYVFEYRDHGHPVVGELMADDVRKLR